VKVSFIFFIIILLILSCKNDDLPDYKYISKNCYTDNNKLKDVTSNSLLDKEIDAFMLSVKDSLNEYWDLNIKLQYYDDSSEGLNACCDRKGNVYIGRYLLSELCYRDNGFYILGIIMSHEWAHQKQFSENKKLKKFRISDELNADELSGYYFGAAQNIFDKESYYESFYEIAYFIETIPDIPEDLSFFNSKFHGEGNQRMNSFSNGFKRGLNEKDCIK